MKKLPIYETFFSWQGEGCHMGKSAYFIRLYGCPVHCPWCDSAGTWHPDHAGSSAHGASRREERGNRKEERKGTKGGASRQSSVVSNQQPASSTQNPEPSAQNPEPRFQRICPRELAERAAERRPHIVVITGGEPAIHDLSELTDCLRERKLKVHLETSGAFPLRGTFDWVTVSPKEWKKPLLDCLVRADELKIVVDSLQAVDYWEKEISHVWCTDSIWLHPEWSKRNDRAILQMINRKVKEGKHPYRAGYQLHKIYEVDEEDTGARQGAPIRN